MLPNLQQYEEGYPVIAWEKVWQGSTHNFKWRTCPALIEGIYNRIIRTTSGDYTRWELDKAYQAYKTGGFDRIYAARFY